MLIVTTIDELRRQTGVLMRERGGPVGLVPTMGALHQGHMSLVHRAGEECNVLVVSIFVNPTQFNEQSDLDNYPRTLEADAALCERNGVDIVFAPSPAEVYPQGFASSVHVSGLTERWEGEFRPGHFDGVATVVAKLFGMAMPDRAYFGEKDFQQLAVVRRMTADLNLPVAVIGCPTVRESEGLAMSSRNSRLGTDDRTSALQISRALQAALVEGMTGNTDPSSLLSLSRDIMERDGILEIEYLAIVDPLTLEPREGELQDRDRIITAVRCGGVRLIDNMELRTQRALQETIPAGQATGTGK
ncbi:MAG: pantoate--beta-alanine ligase [Planctomycetales bacterium]|nr:pantoate--beta-alanine ligase [bacterium]UNM07060.1 MAG: pantoate--beta-alanine ligase [Planctomycetales bacterium]